MTASAYLFTVLTPTYNRADTLRRVYESLARQTLRDFEWLIVDDGSSDNTRAVVEAWQAQADFPIRYIWQKNQHKKTAFNHGVKEAQGQFVVALDSDDEILPDTLATLKEIWESIPAARRADYVAITGLCARPDGSVVGDPYPQDVFDSTAADVYFRYRIQGEKFGCMRTDILRRFPFPDDIAGFVPESLVWWAISRAGYLSRFVNRVLRVYHDNPQGLSQGAVSVQGNAQGLYLLAWDMLENHFDSLRYRPKDFVMAAARYTRFRLHLQHARMDSVLKAYPLKNSAAQALVMLMWPLAYVMYRRDRRRQAS